MSSATRFVRIMGRTMHDKGDLVTWRVNNVHYTGIVLEVWDSNVYEPEECNVLLPSGQTAVVRARNLRSLQRLEDIKE